MPNLVAIVDPSAEPETLRADLSRMMDAVDLPAFGFERRQACSAGAAAGNVLPGINRNAAQPARSGDRWLMLDGEILNVARLKADLRRAGRAVETEDDAELAMLAFETFGADFFERLEGTWNLVFHDPSTGHTYVVTDRMGSRILYFAHDGARYVVANEIKGVVAGRKVTSRAGGVGLLSLLSAGGHHGDATWIDGVKTVLPGTVVRLGPDGQRTERRYWRFAFNEGGPEMSESDYAGAFARTLAAATERCMKDSRVHDVAITLSGGLDSRAVALSVDPRHLPMKAITYGDEDSADVRYAKQLAQVIGLDHMYIEAERAGLEARAEQIYRDVTGASGAVGFYGGQADQILWRCEALTNFDGLASMIWHPIYRRHMRFMLNGAAGDAMTGSHLTPNLMVFPNRQAVVEDLLRRFFFQPDEVLQQVLTHRYFEQSREARDDAFRGGFDDIDADEPCAVANVWDMENRQRRGAFTSFVMERYFCDCRSPFLDYELCDVLARVPARWRFQQRIYKRMLIEHHPRAAHVPWAYTEGRITTSPSFEFAREVFNFSRERLKRLLPKNQTARQRWDFRDAVGMMRADQIVRRNLVDFTHCDLFPSDVLDAAGIRKLAEDFEREGTHMQHVLYTALAGVGRVTEMLLGDEVRMPETADPARFGVPTSD